jgi:hypothetical protein
MRHARRLPWTVAGDEPFQRQNSQKACFARGEHRVGVETGQCLTNDHHGPPGKDINLRQPGLYSWDLPTGTVWGVTDPHSSLTCKTVPEMARGNQKDWSVISHRMPVVRRKGLVAQQAFEDPESCSSRYRLGGIAVQDGDPLALAASGRHPSILRTKMERNLEYGCG